ncbi:ADP-forming succinate--CoA ligase subunit beta [Rhodospirillaceae bacterium SYSU D60014]|uniref:ADP-forming succinate--CoA ligase subunit beta n=1 Tax=Virgifigura deserti TaxID=2268457 RepID=UPI000E662801
MNIHEFQAKQLLRGYGVAVLDGDVAHTPQEAQAAAAELGGSIWVVKAQIHAGGRGKAGGVAVVRSLGEVAAAADRMLGMRLVTHQTGPDGKEVKRVYIERGCAIARELYLAMLVDRKSGGVTVMASTEGGMDIETVAAETPDRILTLTLPPATPLQPFHARRIALALGLRDRQLSAAAKFLTALNRAFTDLDASLIEINPWVVTEEGDLLALDAKVSFDDNALFRHRRIEELRDDDESDPLELEAARHDLNYVKLDGNIGCMVNGAGLAMATMDIIKLYGGEPANFMDIAGAATKERVATAFRLVASDPSVCGILVNVFGGMMRCNSIAEGIVEAAREVGFDRPLVVRLEGTNVELGRQILGQSSVPITSAATLSDAAQKIVHAVRSSQGTGALRLVKETA